ncbi:MAG: response regulator [bacterium]
MIRVLIAEDDETVLETIKLALSDEGYIIDTAHNGTEALDILLKQLYDIVVCDMNLGDTTGINVLKASRNMNRDIKFILVTAHSSVESAVEAIRCGIYDYMLKPFDTAELKFRVRQAVEKIEADKQKKQIENQYHTIMDNIPFGIAVISSEMEIIEVNKQIQEWFPEMHISETPRCFHVFCTPPQEKICHECAVEKTLKNGKQHIQLRYIHCNGINRKIRCTINPIFDKKKHITGVLKVMEEIE